MANSVGQAFKDPAFVADATVNYTADEIRQIFDLTTTPGRRDDNSLLVTQHAGTASLSVDVGVGGAIVPSGTADASGMTSNGFYGVRLMTGCTVGPVATPPTSGTRIDVVYLQVADKTVVGSGNNEAIIKIQTGTSGTNPAKPAIPASSIELASLAIGTNVTTILNANITRNMNFATSPGISPSPRQGAYWGSAGGYPNTHIPVGGYWTPNGASITVNAIGGHCYLASSDFALYCAKATGAYNWRSCLGIGPSIIVEIMGAVHASTDGSPSAAHAVHIQRIWRCPATGQYTLTTKLATTVADSVGITQPYSSPYTEFTDLGPMA